MKEKRRCKYCGYEMRDDTFICVKCGKPNVELDKPRAMGCLTVVIIVSIIVFLYGVTNVNMRAPIEKKKESTKLKASYTVNESCEIDGKRISMKEVNTDFKDYPENSSPREGKKYVMARFEIENTSEDTESMSVNSDIFNAYADDVAISSESIAANKYEELSAVIGKGQKTTGCLFYEVPVNTEKIVLEYNGYTWTEEPPVKFILSE